MNGLCERPFPVPAVDLCGRCGEEFCQDCLVYPFGQKRLPYCLSCAVTAAGVRSGLAAPRAVGRRDRRHMMERRKLLRERSG